MQSQRLLIWFISYYLLLTSALPVAAQVDTTTSEQTPFLEQADSSGITITDHPTADELNRLLRTRELAAIDAELAENQYQKAYWEYYTKDLTYRVNVFNWQHESARMTFAVAVLIVLCGLIFSGIQFRIAMKQAMLRAEQVTLLMKKQADAAGAGQTDTQSSADLDKLLATNLKVSAQGVEVSSSILGVIILVLSLAFFYMYLAFVFPIKETNFDLSGPRTEQPETRDSTAHE